MNKKKKHGKNPNEEKKRIRKEIKKMIKENPIEVILEKIKPIQDLPRLIKWASEANWLAKKTHDKELREKAYTTKYFSLVKLYKDYPEQVELVFQSDSLGSLAFKCGTGIGYPWTFHIPIEELKRMGFLIAARDGEIFLEIILGKGSSKKSPMRAGSTG